MEFVSNIVLAFQVSEQPTAKLRAADALGNMGSSVSNFVSFMIHFYGYFFNKNKPCFLTKINLVSKTSPSVCMAVQYYSFLL